MAVASVRRTFEENTEHVERVWGCRNKACPDFSKEFTKVNSIEKEQGE